jgi:carbon-monoxide dehydrogenase medium subunit
MKPPKFQYLRPDNLRESLEALQTPEAKVLAGGQSLVPMLNFRLLRPSMLVDINRVRELDYLEETAAGGLKIGALTRHHKLETSPVVKKHFPMLATAVARIGHLAIRNRGTIGGSLAHADPAAEHLLMAMLLDAMLTIKSKAGSRTIPVKELVAGALSTTLAPGEVLAEVELPPVAGGAGWGFEEHARRSGDFAIAAAAVLIESSSGKVSRARIAVSGGANGPIRVAEAESALRGRVCDEAALSEAVKAVRRTVVPNTDLHASAELRHHILDALVRRSCKAAWLRAAGRTA